MTRPERLPPEVSGRQTGINTDLSRHGGINP